MASKDAFRGVAASLFLSGSILAGFYYFQPEMIAVEINSEEITENELDLSSIEKQGYIALSEEEHSKQQNEFTELQLENEKLIRQITQLEESMNPKEEESSSSISPETSKDLFYSILSIEQGMTSQDISDKLLKLNIIENRASFVLELSEKEVEDRIQIGKYTLNNQMSIEEIVQLITS